MYVYIIFFILIIIIIYITQPFEKYEIKEVRDKSENCILIPGKTCGQANSGVYKPDKLVCLDRMKQPVNLNHCNYLNSDE